MNFASTLKHEISRVSRKEVRSETHALKKSSAQYRSDIAALKRRLAELERLVKQLSKTSRAPRTTPTEASPAGKVRFSAKGLASHRQKLGLSAEQYGSLIGVSGQSIYKWERERATPRAAQLAKLVAIRGLGKREALARLDNH